MEAHNVETKPGTHDEHPDEADNLELNVFCPDPTSTTKTTSKAPNRTPTLNKPKTDPQRARQLRRGAVEGAQGRGHAWSERVCHAGARVRYQGQRAPGDQDYCVGTQVKEGCEQKVDEGEFLEYMHVPIDSCNCAGVNGM